MYFLKRLVADVLETLNNEGKEKFGEDIESFEDFVNYLEALLEKLDVIVVKSQEDVVSQD